MIDQLDSFCTISAIFQPHNDKRVISFTIFVPDNEFKITLKNVLSDLCTGVSWVVLKHFDFISQIFIIPTWIHEICNCSGQFLGHNDLILD